MREYLGTTPIVVEQHPVYSKYTPVDWAMLWVEKYGQFDGSHHKAWVIDQVARILKGTPVIVELAAWSGGLTEERFYLDEPTEQYKDWVIAMLGELTEDGEYEYSYDEGIAP